jgi:hypothetical protein
MNFEKTHKSTEIKLDNPKEQQRLFDNSETQASDESFFQVISSLDDEFREILKSANILNAYHSEKSVIPNAFDAFVQQFGNDSSSIVGVVSIAEHYGIEKIKERHWEVAQSIFQKYSFNGQIYQAIEQVEMKDSDRLKMTMAINSLLKNIDIYLKEQHFYEFYEQCRQKFEPDATETENYPVGEVNSTK